MRYIYSCQTDVGAVRENNQDSLVVKSLNLGKHMVVFAAVCDGVGGLSHGERASRTSVEMLSFWNSLRLSRFSATVSGSFSQRLTGKSITVI